MNKYKNIAELCEVNIGKYNVKYKVKNLAYVNVLVIPSASKDEQTDLVRRTIASIPGVEYSFDVQCDCIGNLALRVMPINGVDSTDEEIKYLADNTTVKEMR